jgi:hypothetical protein
MSRTAAPKVKGGRAGRGRSLEHKSVVSERLEPGLDLGELVSFVTECDDEIFMGLFSAPTFHT